MRWLALLLLLSLAVVLTGCAGVNSLTGGSVPIGTVDGWVYRSVAVQPLTRDRADLELQTQAGTPVELELSTGSILRTSTNDAGYFIFRNVPKGKVRVRAGEFAVQYGEVEVNMDSERDAARISLMLAPPQANAVTLLITPAAVATAHPGDDILFTASVITTDKQIIPVPASWAFKGDIGSFGPRMPEAGIAPHGLFHAQAAGNGRVIAQFNGLMAVAPITVLPAGVNP
jgi:hypothetical protein